MTNNVLIAETLDLETLRLAASSKKIVLHEKIEEHTDNNDSAIHCYYLPDIASKNKNLANIIQQKPFSALCVRPYPVTKETINAATNLRLIIRAGAGVNSIDADAANNLHIAIENTPGQNSIATAEFTWECISYLLAKRQLLHTANDVNLAYKNQTLYSLYPPENRTGFELAKKSIAIIGLGAIGSQVAKYANAFGMHVTGYSRTFTKQASSLNEAIQKKNIVSLHIPLTDETQNIIGKEQFDAMQDGTIIINTARPQLIDPNSLKDAIESGKIVGFAIDGDPDQIEPFIAIANQYDNGQNQFLCTHHIADATQEALQKLTQQFLAQIYAFYGTDGKPARLINCVNNFSNIAEIRDA